MDKVILERDGQARTVAAYTHEGGGLYHDLISMHRSDSYYHLFDGLGSVSEVTDADGAVQNRYRYEAFGQFKLADEAVPNPYTYVGAFGVQWDAGTGLHFMQARYYDGANQLVREQRSGDNSYDISYSYDGVGNRLTKVDGSGTTTYSYDEANELITATDPESNITTYTYDANGNLTAQDAAGAVTSYGWDYDNRLHTVTLPDDSVTSFAYDGDGLRRESQSPAETTRFIWDGQDVLLETDGDGTTQVTYTQTPELYGALVSQRRGETTSFYHFDALGSTTELTDADEAATDSYRYNAFGETLTSVGSTPNAFGFVGNLGYYTEPTLALQYLRARWYQPGTGRFVSRDPVDFHPQYVYVSNRPTGLVDPEGLQLRVPIPRDPGIRLPRDPGILPRPRIVVPYPEWPPIMRLPELPLVPMLKCTISTTIDYRVHYDGEVVSTGPIRYRYEGCHPTLPIVVGPLHTALCVWSRLQREEWTGIRRFQKRTSQYCCEFGRGHGCDQGRPSAVKCGWRHGPWTTWFSEEGPSWAYAWLGQTNTYTGVVESDRAFLGTCIAPDGTRALCAIRKL